MFGPQRSGLLNPQQPKSTGTGLLGLLGDPRLMLAMNLLSAGRDRRIDPFQSALSGLMQAQQFRNASDDRERVQAEEERKQAEAERKAWEHKQKVELSERIAALRNPMAMAHGALQGPPQAGESPLMREGANPTLALLSQVDPVAAAKISLQNPQAAQMKQDVNGVWRYVASGNQVFPDVKVEPDEEHTFKVEKNLRDEFRGLTTDFRKQEDAMGKILASAKNPSAAGDLALIFNYMKVLDPGSTVREGEFANAQNAGGVDSKVVAIYNNIVSGKRLSPQQRNDFVLRAGMLYEDAVNAFKQKRTEYTGLATSYDLDPARIIVSDPRFDEDDYGGVEKNPPLTPAQEAKLKDMGY